MDVGKVLGGGLVSLFFALIVAALTVMGVISMALGHFFMAAAWAVGAILIYSEILPGKKGAHKFGAVVLLAVLIFAADFGIVKLKGSQGGGIDIAFPAQFIDLSKSTGSSWFWVGYNSGFGGTISPVSLLVFLDIENKFNRPVYISSYTLSIKTDSCGWLYLTPIDPDGKVLFYALNGLGERNPVIDSSSDLHYLWSQPISPHQEQFGMLLFSTSVACQIVPGSRVQLRIDLSASGKIYTVTSPEILVSDKFPMSSANSIESTNKPRLSLTGDFVDTTKAKRVMISDPIWSLPPSQRGQLGLGKGLGTGTIILSDVAMLETKQQ